MTTVDDRQDGEGAGLSSGPSQWADRTHVPFNGVRGEIQVPTFQVRYKIGQGPADADENGVVTLEAAMFRTEGKFVDFYSDAAVNTLGGLNPKGGVVFRVHEDVLADVRQQ